MPKTYGDILTEARVLLQDADEDSYRDSQEVLVAKLNRALQELARLRPEAFDLLFTTDANGGSLNVPEVTVAGLGTNFPLDMMFYTPLVYFVTASAELKDDEFTSDGRVSAMMSQFRTMVVGI